MHTMRVNLLIIILMTSSYCFTQSGVEKYLTEVEKSNLQLISARKLLEAKKIEAKTGLVPDNPIIEYGYFPGENSTMGIKKVYGISQSFEFPTIYATKKRIATSQIQTFEYEYQELRLGILLEAKRQYYIVVYNMKQEKNYKTRLDKAEKLYKLYHEKYINGATSKLELRKAEIQYLASKSDHRLILNELENNKTALQNYINNNIINLDEASYSEGELLPPDTFKRDMFFYRPELKALQKNIELSNYYSKLNKQSWLPSFELGYEAESEPDGTYSGIKAGIIIPLWKDKNNVKLANAQTEFSQSVYSSTLSHYVVEIEKGHAKAMEYKKILKEYNDLLTKTDEFSFLKKALDAGQISLIEYINELTLYYELIDTYLKMELEYYKIMAELYSFRL